MKYKNTLVIIFVFCLLFGLVYSMNKISFLFQVKTDEKIENKEIDKDKSNVSDIKINKEENKVSSDIEAEKNIDNHQNNNIPRVDLPQTRTKYKSIINKKALEKELAKKTEIAKEKKAEEKIEKSKEIIVEPSKPLEPKKDENSFVKEEETKEIYQKESVKTTYEKDGKKITTLWVKGIIPPNINDFTKEKHNDYLIQTIPYNYNKGWFDVNKSGTGYSDRVLCSGAVASNMIHWWLLQNKKYIDKYLKLHPEKTKLSNDNNVWKNLNHYLDSFSSQNDSKVFDMFKLYYGKTNGIWADTSVDFFINGYKASLSGATNDPEKYERDDRGGFFYDVFKTNVLTNRYFSGNYEEFSDAIKTELQNGNIIGLSHRTGSKKANHIITVWGADFDDKGKIIGIYLTDSDDYSETKVAMRRLNVNNKDGKPVITASMKKDIGINLEYIHTLSLGTKYWEDYFK